MSSQQSRGVVVAKASFECILMGAGGVANSGDLTCETKVQGNESSVALSDDSVGLCSTR